MRSGLVLTLASTCLLSTLSTPVQAQFQQPTNEELSMTADPKAPGADAIFLNVQEVANDPLHFQSFYARIKVLTEKGKGLATVEVPYLKGNDKITDIKARTIHPDGTVIPLTGKPEDLLVSRSIDRQVAQKVFNLPSVEVGSILEYRYELRYDDNHYSSPMWEIQRPYFVRKAHYQFTPFKAFMPGRQEETSMFLVDAKGRRVNTLIWWAHLPEGSKVESSAAGYYTVDVSDIPPIPHEEWMPPIQSLLYKVFFYYKSASTAQEFWATEAKDWSKDVDRFAEQSGTVREAVAGLITAGDKDDAKARKLYKAVEALDNTDYSRNKGVSEMKQLQLKEAKHAEDTWKQKSGDSEDIAMLYVAMARAAGLKAYAVKIVARNKGVFDATYMDRDQLDDTLVLVSIDGKTVLLDPGEKMCPFATVNWRHSSAGGLRQSENGPGYAVTPMQSYNSNYTSRVGDIAIDAHGAITGTIRITMTGQEALDWRQSSLRNDDNEVKRQFDRSLEQILPAGVEGHVHHFLGMDDPESGLMAVVNVKGTLGTATSKRLLLPGYFFQSRERAPFVSQEKRLEAVDMQYGLRVGDEITYRLPEGMTVEGAPADANIPWKGHAVYVTKTIATPGGVVVSRALARGFTQAKPEEYQDLRGFYQKVAASDQQQLVLAVSKSAAKGD